MPNKIYDFNISLEIPETTQNPEAFQDLFRKVMEPYLERLKKKNVLISWEFDKPNERTK